MKKPSPAEGRKALRQRLRAAVLTGIIRDMARCTAPVYGHRTASGRAACPACGGSGGYGYGSPYSSYTPSYTSSGSSGGGRSTGGGSGSSARPRWARAGSSVTYTTTEVRALTPIRETVEKQVPLPEGRDFFLAMLGTTGQGPLRNCTTCSNHAVYRSGSARKTSASVHRSFAKSTGD
jgi:hypothetical protein